MLNSEQRKAVAHFEGPMLVLAGPGSGKTKVITERIRYLIEMRKVKADEILVITFSQKAARQMQQRFYNSVKKNSYPVNFGTFHAVFYHILIDYSNYSKDSLLKEKDKERILTEVYKKLGKTDACSQNGYKDILDDISAYKNLGNDFFENILRDRETDDIELFKRIYKEYTKKCKAEAKIDFDDMILLCRNMLLRNHNILRKIRQNYKYILVDEFQDINDLQYDVLKLLAGESENVFAVGDDDQSIYAFRGAKPSLMSKFTKDYANCIIVNLNINYRCRENIVEAADELIRNNCSRIERGKQHAYNNGGRVEIVEAYNTTSQAEYVCDKIMDLKTKYNLKFSDFAVIYRSGHGGKMFSEICKVRNIPILNRIKNNCLLNLEEVRICLSYFKVARGKSVRSDYLAIINNPAREISREALIIQGNNYFEGLYIYYENDKSMTEIIKIMENDLHFIGKLNPFLAFSYLYNKIGLKEFFINKYTNKINRQEIIDKIKNYMKEYSDIDSLLEAYERDINSDNYRNDVADKQLFGKVNKRNIHEDEAESDDGINMLTAHASKGLEFDTVFVIGLQEGIFPHNKNLHKEAVEEERRLCYVAMTRAINRLYMCCIGSEHGKQKSRFIGEILKNQSFISSNSSLSRNSSKASATASYSSSSSI